MNRKNLCSLLLSTLLVSSLVADESAVVSPAIQESAQPAANNEEALEADLFDKEAEKIAMISEAFGHIIAKHIESLGIDFDLPRLVKGLQDAGEGKNPPMSDVECIEAITKVRQHALEEVASANLDRANIFMKENEKHPQVTVLEEGKLHIRIDQQGKGDAVTEGCTPVIRYTGKFIDGAVFGASKEDDLVTLDETIPGFGRGLLGMKEGEKRTVFIHPDLAYGTVGQLPPNSLLIFEVELVKANAESAQEVVAPVVEAASSSAETAAAETIEHVDAK